MSCFLTEDTNRMKKDKKNKMVKDDEVVNAFLYRRLLENEMKLTYLHSKLDKIFDSYNEKMFNHVNIVNI